MNEDYNNKICPWTKIKRNVNNGGYYKMQGRKLGISKEECRFRYLNFYFPELCNEKNLVRLYETELGSLPYFRNKFGIKYNDTLFLLKWFGIKSRTIKEVNNLITLPKTKQYLINHYGVENASQVEEVKEKKRQTFIKHYGVDNIWKAEEFKNKLNSYFIEKYGISMTEYRSISSKKLWDSKTEEERKTWLNNSIHSVDCKKRSCGTYNSSLEIKIQTILNEMKISYTTHYLLRNKPMRKIGYFYDLYIKEFNLLIELNGVYWHADPRRYSSNDLIFYSEKMTAQEVWDKDKLKVDCAIRQGYNIITLWELDIINKSEVELITLISNELNKIKINS